MPTTLSNELQRSKHRSLPLRVEEPPPILGGRDTIVEAIQHHNRLRTYVDMALASDWVADDVYGDVEDIGLEAVYQFNHCVNHRERYVANLPEFARFPGTRESRQVQANNRRGRLQGVDHCLTDAEWGNILDEFGHCCAYCHRGSDMLVLEHLQPIVRGGGTEKWNVVPACVECNTHKGGKDPRWWVGVKHLEELRVRLRRANP